MHKPQLIVIGGATASGKSALAVELCKRLNGEVVSCDSMQIYRRMDIGTAKPTREEMQGITHHMIDVVEPECDYDVSTYMTEADGCIRDILARGKLPVLCGGTGLYIDALIKGLTFSSDSDEDLREELRRIALTEAGRHELHERLKSIDPDSAARLHENDIRRVIRSIEIYEVTGKTQTEHMKEDSERETAYDARCYAFDWDREPLYDRINRRVDVMFRNGLADEVKALLDSGVPMNCTSMQALGYKETAMYVKGFCSREDTAEAIKTGSRHYAKRQLTWLRRDGGFTWLDPKENTETTIDRIRGDLNDR